MVFNSRSKSVPFSKLLFSLLAVAVLGTSCPTRASADDCVALGGALNAGECQISGNQIKSNANCLGGVSCQLDETLHFLNPSSLTISPIATGLTLNITGDFIMEPGSKINGDVATSATAAKITVNATGNVTLKQGVGLTPGAIITASQPSGSCTASAKAGKITLNADVDGNFTGDVDIQGSSSAGPDDRAKVLANGCSGGEIIITGVKINNDGLVESVGRVSGIGANQIPGGGPITIDAACELTISDTGKVSSRGVDPGADLVHLEGGCTVEINGLVESTGIGHAVPTSPRNRCNSTFRPDKPANSTACVEVWAGGSLTINSLAPHNGEINANTGGPGGSNGTGWIDLFARGDIGIIGFATTVGPTATKWTVHANGLANTNDVGGLIDVESTEGEVSANGRALQANATGSGGKGGTINVEAKLDVDVQGGLAQAKGATSGGAPAGGKITAQSWGTAPATGSIVSDANSKLDVTGGLAANPATLGAITLTACGTIGFPPGVTAPAAVTPAKTTGVCGGNPQLSSYVVLPNCPPECNLFGQCACVNEFVLAGPTAPGTTLTLTGHEFIGTDPANPNIQSVGFNSTCVPNPLCRVAVTPTSDTSITLTLPACALPGNTVIVGIDGNTSFSCTLGTLP